VVLATAAAICEQFLRQADARLDDSVAMRTGHAVMVRAATQMKAVRPVGEGHAVQHPLTEHQHTAAEA
jgi:hypothetical protein